MMQNKVSELIGGFNHSKKTSNELRAKSKRTHKEIDEKMQTQKLELGHLQDVALKRKEEINKLKKINDSDLKNNEFDYHSNQKLVTASDLKRRRRNSYNRYKKG